MADKTSGMDEISTKDFQRKLFDWFEKRGLLSELRAFMRYRMISALYSSESPCPANHFNSQTTVSPALQALLLLVAEFLVQQEYHYTMSVMVAEVPLLATFPKFSDYVSYMSNSDSLILKKCCDLPRYAKKDVMEILEVLGMTPDSESTQHILRLYSNNSARESLLACILTALSAIVQHSTPNQSKPPDQWFKLTSNTNESTHWIEEIRLILLRAQVTSAQIQHVEAVLSKLHSDTANRVRKEEQEKYNKMNCMREQQILAEVLVREENFRARTVEAEEDLRKKQSHLEQVTTQLKQQHDEVLNRLNRVQSHADEIRKQEVELTLREKALEQKQASIEEEHRTLAGLRAELQEAAHSIRQDHSDTKTLLELNRLQERCLHLENELKDAKNHFFSSGVIQADIGVQVSEIHDSTKQRDSPSHQGVLACGQQHSSGVSECSSNSYSKFGCEKLKDRNERKERSNQITLLKRVLRRVQQENSELRANSSQQRRRIDELTTRAAHLATHIADQVEPVQAQAQAQLPLPDVRPQVPPQAPPLPPRLTRHGVQIGAGGDLTQAGSRHSPATAAHTVRLQGREWRRKPPKRLIQHSSLTTSLSSDESPTEEVLREARNRLRRLEEESEVVDRSYRDFRARQADHLTSTASVLFVPTQQSPSHTTPPAQVYQERQSLTVPLPAAPSVILRSTPILSPEAVQSRPIVLSSRPVMSGLPPNVLALQQSQFTLPERSVYSLPQASNSLPYRPLVLGRPAEKLRNLLGSRSTLLREFSARDVAVSQTANEKAQSEYIEAKQEDCKIMSVPQKESTSNVSKAADGLQNMSLEASSTVQVNSPAVLGEAGLSVIDSQLPTKVSPINKTSNHSSMQSLPIKKDKEERNLVSNASFVGAVGTGNQPQDEYLMASSSNFVKKPEQDCESPSQRLVINKTEDSNRSSSRTLLQIAGIKTLDENPRSPHQTLIESGATSKPNLICESHAPSESVAAKQTATPEKSVVKLIPIDSTSNEVSTLSSATVSVANLGNVISKGTPGTQMNSHIDLQNNNFEISVPSTLPSRIIETEFSNPKLATVVTKSKNGNSTAGSANQLLNTSLSSIENSDQRISAGSGGRNTDVDDDDFW